MTMGKVNLISNPNAWELLHKLFVKYLVIAEYGDALEKLSKPQATLYLTYEFDKEVKNGSFDQYFFNSSGNNSHEAVGALQTIGAIKTSNLLQECINVWPNQKVPKDWEKRRNAREELEDEAKTVWDNCTTIFYKGGESIPELLFAYIDSKPEEFE
jgi:hypothetical protein